MLKVKTHESKPYLDLFTKSMASSASFTDVMGITGPNVSSHMIFASVGT
jgi:hypothetical protein